MAHVVSIRSIFLASVLGVGVLVAACSSSGTASPSDPASSDAATSPADSADAAADPGSPSGAPTSDPPSSPDDASTPPPSDASTSSDGTPVRVTCTKSFGNAVTPTYGRLDGTLVSVVPPNHHGCNGDSTHIHLQVKANGATYDVAVNVDGLWTEVDHDPIGIAWTEGWNTTASLDYPSRLGLHSDVFKTTDANALEQELGNVNHISVFATGYGPTGVHLVHRNGNDHDGALVLNPLSSKPRYVAFRFDNKPSF